MTYQTKSRRCLGIDPGITHTGLCIVASDKIGSRYQLLDAELVKTASADDTGKRLQEIHEAITRLLEKHAPDAIAIERVFHAENVSSSISTGKVIGVAELLAHQHALPVYLLTPKQVKNASGFGGSANKEQMVKQAQRMWGKKEISHHEADAAFASLCGLLKMRSEVPDGKS